VDDVSKSATSTLIYAVDAQKSDIVTYLLANGTLPHGTRHTLHDTTHTHTSLTLAFFPDFQAPM